MGILSWIVVGALAGWIASMIMGKNDQMGAVANIGVGIAGAIIAGFILKLFGVGGINGLNLYSIMMAILGAVLLLWVIDKIKK
jgi:uncharacterized membrane protein YeaQ/YmgE (transglycosylase-associated protein family)